MNHADMLYEASRAIVPLPNVPGGQPTRSGTTLFPYQVAGVQNIRLRGNAYCGHSPGSGKTAIALVKSMDPGPADPVIVVCPPSIVYQWARNAMTWTGVPWYIIATTAEARQFDPGAMLPARFIISDTVIHEIPETAKQIALLVWDEAHRGKNRDSRRTRAFYGHGTERGLAQRADQILALSGTPMPNNPTELYPYLHATYPEIAPTFSKFAARYCPPESQWVSGREILVYKTATNKDELGRKLRETCMIRPRREDILGQLPPVRYDTVPIRLGESCGMSASDIVDGFRHGSDEVKKALATERMHVGIVKSIAAIPYLETVLDGGDAPVIWTWHREAAERLADGLECPLIHGGKTPEERRDALDRFARGDRALVATIQSAGIGIDGLQHRTDLAIYLENSYVPQDYEQSIARLQRIGQKNPVRVTSIMSDHPMDYAIESIRNTKEIDITEIID